MIATMEDLRRLKVEKIREEFPKKQAELEAKIEAATAHIRPPDNMIQGAAVRRDHKWKQSRVTGRLK